MTQAPAASHASPQSASSASSPVPDLGYRPVPDVFKLPVGLNFGACSGVAVSSNGNILVFNRSAQALMEFKEDGSYVQTLARDMFVQPHGLRLDAEENIWVTDIGLHMVFKMTPRGRILLVL